MSTNEAWIDVNVTPPPKDGTEIILFFPHYSGTGVRAARYRDDDGYGEPCWDMIDSYEPNIEDAKMWQPMPLPPTVKDSSNADQ